MSSANNNDIFAILVDTRKPKYAGFTHPLFAEHYHAYRDGPYVVVAPVHPVPQTLVETLKTKRWTEEELQQQLGAPRCVLSVGPCSVGAAQVGWSFYHTPGLVADIVTFAETLAGGSDSDYGRLRLRIHEWERRAASTVPRVGDG